MHHCPAKENYLFFINLAICCCKCAYAFMYVCVRDCNYLCNVGMLKSAEEKERV